MPRKHSKARNELRRTEAEQLQIERDKLTDEQQLAKLDTMFGDGQGAKKERARLEKRIQAKKQVAKAPKDPDEKPKDETKGQKKTKAPPKEAGRKDKRNKS